jgi:VanZ family protein
MLRFLKYGLPVVVWMALIFQMSTDFGSAANTSRFVEPFLRWLIPNISPDTIEWIHFCLRKTAHLGEYAVLGLLLWRAFRQTRLADASRSPWKIALAALLVSAAYAATDEFHQSFVCTRNPSVRDVIIDTCGSFLGLCVVYTRHRQRGRHQKHPPGFVGCR